MNQPPEIPGNSNPLGEAIHLGRGQRPPTREGYQELPSGEDSPLTAMIPSARTLDKGSTFAVGQDPHDGQMVQNVVAIEDGRMVEVASGTQHELAARLRESGSWNGGEKQAAPTAPPPPMAAPLPEATPVGRGVHPSHVPPPGHMVPTAEPTGVQRGGTTLPDPTLDPAQFGHYDGVYAEHAANPVPEPAPLGHSAPQEHLIRQTTGQSERLPSPQEQLQAYQQAQQGGGGGEAPPLPAGVDVQFNTPHGPFTSHYAAAFLSNGFLILVTDRMSGAEEHELPVFEQPCDVTVQGEQPISCWLSGVHWTMPDGSCSFSTLVVDTPE
jgi:hypothetical protein